MSARDEFVALAADWGLDDPLTDGTALVASGRLDSLALFRLALWAEERTGRQLDPTAFDPAVEWATVGDFLAFVERLDRAGAPTRAGEHGAAVSLGGREYRIAGYEPSMKQAVASFQQGLWRHDPLTNQRYLEWKYELNPFAAGSRIYLVFCGGELVGMRGFYGSLWEAGRPAERFPILIADDLLIHEHHRSTGLFNHLMRYAIDDLARSGQECVLNLTANEANRAGSLATGWRVVKPLRPLTRRSWGLALRGVLARGMARSPFVWRWSDARWLQATPARDPFARLDDRGASSAAGGRLRVESRRDAPLDEMAGLVAALPHDGRIRHVRTPEYLAWRFANPFGNYRFVLARGRDGALEAYAVLTCSQATGGIIAISDVEARDIGAVDALLRHVLRHACPTEILAWGSALPQGSEAILRGRGFTGRARHLEDVPDASILAKPIGKDTVSARVARLLDERAWDMRMLYSMRG